MTIQFDPTQKPGQLIRLKLSESVDMALVWCPAGEFLMGSPDTDDLADTIMEKPQHKVKLSRGFWIGQVPVTQEQWLLLMEPETILSTTGGPLPAFGMIWDDAKEFCSRLTALWRKQANLDTDQLIDLPTEAQWEYACRAGTQTRWHFGDDVEQLVDYAWFRDNHNDYIWPVGLKKPNPWHLYDCYGCVAECCHDTIYFYKQLPSEIIDPCIVSDDPYFRVTKGGDYQASARRCRSASREHVGATNQFNDPTGVRVVCIDASP